MKKTWRNKPVTWGALSIMYVVGFVLGGIMTLAQMIYNGLIDLTPIEEKLEKLKEKMRRNAWKKTWNEE